MKRPQPSSSSPPKPGSASPAGHAAPLDYHRRLLDDPVRMDAYERALRHLVRPGDVVLDLGAGTGILSILAARRGARVHAVESMPVADLAREMIHANGLQDRVQVHRADARSLEPLEPVDLLVTDCMGRFLVDDAMLPAVRGGRRWLRPGARCCPDRIDLQLAPVGDVSLRAVDRFTQPAFGLDLSAATRYALNCCYRAQLGPQAQMAPAQRYHRWEVAQEAPPFDAQLVWRLRRGGRLQGLAGWFDARLAPEVQLSTGPGIETHWGQYLFPLPPTLAQRGDEIQARLWLDPPEGDAATWRWEVRLRRGEETLLSTSLESEQRLGERPWPERDAP